MRKITLSRPITDYTKIQFFIGHLIRCNPFFMRKKSANKEYLDIGCGPNVNDRFVTLDYVWSRKIDVCWDLTKKPLPFKTESFIGVYSEHCFEHIPLESFIANMTEIYRVLKPGGTFRLIMPDGELYLDIYQRKKAGEKISMPFEEGYLSPMHRINGIFRKYGHQFIYDFDTVEKILKKSGFSAIKKETYRNGRDKNLLYDSESRAIESLYVEATK
jgi:predicted SAM-dependent methyltransferase